MKQVVILLFLSISLSVFSQELFFSCETQYSLHKKIKVVFEPEISFIHTPILSLERLSLTNALFFKTSKVIRNEIGYRLQTKSNNNESLLFDSNESLRFYADMSFRMFLNSRFRCVYRYRLQSRISDSEVEYEARNRIKCIHERKNGVQPYFIIEMYTSMRLNEFNKGKCTIGIEHEYLKKYSFEEYFTIEFTIQGGVPRMYYKMGFGITIE